MALTLHQGHDGLPLTHIEVVGLFLKFLSCDDLHGIEHDALAFPQHDYVVDQLRMRLPVFRQVKRLPSEVVQLVVLTKKTNFLSRCRTQQKHETSPKNFESID